MSSMQIRTHLVRKIKPFSAFHARSLVSIPKVFHSTPSRFTPLPIKLNNIRYLSQEVHPPPAVKLELESLKCDTLVEMLHNSCQRFATNNIFGTLVNGKYEWMTYQEFGQVVVQVRKVLYQHGLRFDGKVGIIANNRVEWASIMYAALGLGGQMVPMYEAQPEHDWKYIIEDSDATILFASTPAIYEKVKDYAGKVGKIQHVFCLEAPETEAHSYKYWLKKVAQDAEIPISTQITSDHLSTLIYTSGTTGKPKGVELTHRNIITELIGSATINEPFLQSHLVMAFLPWAHVFAHTSELQAGIASGSTMALVPSREMIMECLGLVRPTVMVCVPALYNRIYDAVMKNVALQSSIKQSLFHLALKIARQVNHRLEFGQPVSPWLAWQHKMVDKVVLSKIRARFGGRLRYMGSGGAALSLEVLQFFQDIGIPIVEGYGLTETAPVSHMTIDWSARRLGTVGIALKDINIHILDPDTLEDIASTGREGEIAVSGPSVMRGYRNRPEETKEVFLDKVSADGKTTVRLFRTGDKGCMVENKFLKITGRIKEQFKLENGKYVVPAPLENIYARGPFIAQCFLYGENRPYNVLLVVPNYAELINYAKEKKLDDLLKLIPQPTEVATLPMMEHLPLFAHPEFVKLVSKEIIRHGSAKCKGYEQAIKWQPIVQPFSQENQMQTPKMSLRRPNVLKAYQSYLDGMYAGSMGHTVKQKGSANKE